MDAEGCVLCGNPATLFARAREKTYFRCGTCRAVYLDRASRLSPEAEMARYLKHTNDAGDPGYRRFAAPLVARITDFFAPGHDGLDFGSGPGSAVAGMLKEQGYRLEAYDPFFADNTGLLARTYDFIVCCEAMEHFYAPAREFSRLRKMLRPGGSLFCMTHLYADGTDFVSWYYKNDPTHVFFYHERTLAWIRQQCGFRDVLCHGRVIRFLG